MKTRSTGTKVQKSRPIYRLSKQIRKEYNKRSIKQAKTAQHIDEPRCLRNTSQSTAIVSPVLPKTIKSSMHLRSKKPVFEETSATYTT
jgi:hypothetical protein